MWGAMLPLGCGERTSCTPSPSLLRSEELCLLRLPPNFCSKGSGEFLPRALWGAPALRGGFESNEKRRVPRGLEASGRCPEPLGGVARARL